jgi:hypothetical protein
MGNDGLTQKIPLNEECYYILKHFHTKWLDAIKYSSFLHTLPPTRLDDLPNNIKFGSS